MKRTLTGLMLGTASLVTVAARPAPTTFDRVDTHRTAVIATLARGDTNDAWPNVLVLRAAPEDPPRVARKASRAAIADETRRWLLDLRPAGAIPLPSASGTRVSLPVILPDDE
ncbi:MAG: hypothetical protein R3B81_06535 [bacterium]